MATDVATRPTPDPALSTFIADDECHVFCDFGLVVAFCGWIAVDKVLSEMTNVPLLHDEIDRFDN